MLQEQPRRLTAFYELSQPSVVNVASQVSGLNVAIPDARNQDDCRQTENAPRVGS